MLDKTNKDDVVTAAHLIPGWCYIHEMALIYELVKHSRTHVEIGTFCGKTTFVAGLAMPDNSKIIGVDAMDFGWIEKVDRHFRLPYVADDRGQDTPSWPEDMLNVTRRAINIYNPSTEVVLIKKPSVQAAIDCKDMLVDSIFIDGNHSCEGVCTDIDCWYPMLKPGGIMFGHDYCTAHFGTIEAVNMQFGDGAKYPGGFEHKSDTRIWTHIKPIPTPSEARANDEVLKSNSSHGRSN
jgi:hypothetical protein